MGCLNSDGGNETLPGKPPFPVQTSVLLTVLVGILVLLTVCGNVIVAIAVMTSRALRGPQNLFLVSLACADILVATLLMPFSLANELMGYWYFGELWCEIYRALDVLFCTSSIIHLCAISLDRYCSVTQAIEYNLKRTPRRVKYTIIVVWVLAAIISFPPLITIKKNDGNKNCPECKMNEEKWYIVFSCTASYFAPCVIMILVYVRIYLIARKRTRDLPGERQGEYGNSGNTVRSDRDVRHVKGGSSGEVNVPDMEQEHSSSDGNENILCSRAKKKATRTAKLAQVRPGGSSMKPEVRVGKWKERQNRERRLTFVLAVVMGAFVLCWFPFFFTYTLTAVCGTGCVPETLFKIFFWFGYCNSSLNPVIYTVFNRDFRRSFKKIICKRDPRGL